MQVEKSFEIEVKSLILELGNSFDFDSFDLLTFLQLFGADKNIRGFI